MQWGRAGLGGRRGCPGALKACRGCSSQASSSLFFTSLAVSGAESSKRPRKGGPGGGEAPGRSRGGLTSKIHLACDGLGRPLAFTLTGGNVNDCTQLEPVLDQIKIARPGPGRPRTRPGRVVADKGYSARKIRAYLRRRGIAAAIPERIDQINGRIRRGESRCRLDKAAYRRRNVIERCFRCIHREP
ncbi:IS5 family transposase [Streptomyces griseoluteus]|uniref:IS5 family transposase n=1 Tax=Streptomyces griseoluteus TaxID=29306 RepID=UPI0038205342